MNAVAAKVIGELHESAPIYAVLDGARSPSVQSFALSAGAPGWCLHRGNLPQELQEVAPYLRRFGRGHAQTDDFFTESWGAAWGVLLASAAPSKELRRHLRRFLRVRTEEGSVLVFRWFDPRVLRVFLPTLTLVELRRFFGPIEAFAVEDSEDGSFHIFRLTESGLADKLFGPGPSFEPTDLSQPADGTAEMPGLDPARASRHHLLWTLSATSMDALTRSTRQLFVQKMSKELERSFPELRTKLGARMSGQISRGMDEAYRAGLLMPEEVAQFLRLWFQSGFNLEERWPGSLRLLESQKLPSHTKLSLLSQLAG